MANDVYAFDLNTIDGTPQPLEEHTGKVLLFVNVASECGFTPQYAGLQKLSEDYADQDFLVLGIPTNDFGAQEPGSNDEIRSFCTSKFDVTFPMYEKLVVKGPDQHPLYAYLTAREGQVTWNFNKILVGKDGRVIRRFESATTPESGELRDAIDDALKG